VLHTLFISDLHLCSTHPRVTELFMQFAHDIAPQAESLYILGDLFEYWIGDDDLADPFNASIAQTLRKISGGGVKLYFMHGNRDFLLGEKFATACGGKLLNDPLLIDLYGSKTLISHGDALCTADAEYMAFRKQVRDPAFQQQFLAKPLSERRATVEKMRVQSEQSKKIKPIDIMDVTESAVHNLLRQYGYPRLIHGHTHRQALHQHQVDGKICERYVLKDWNETGGYLYCDTNGCSAINFTK
jgi:UDP-2,3-diacylglucosamine hydrolase